MVSGNDSHWAYGAITYAILNSFMCIYDKTWPIVPEHHVAVNVSRFQNNNNNSNKKERNNLCDRKLYLTFLSSALSLKRIARK